MNNFSEEVVDCLVAMRDNKKYYEDTKAGLRVKLVTLAIETGLTHEEAFVKNLGDYFDGWLIARGHVQAYRRLNEENE
jgi:hypothetical protein